MSSFDGGGGWDNDNFLESLGSGGNSQSNEESNARDDAMERANEEYYQQSRYGRPQVVEPEEITRTSDPSVDSYPSRLNYADALQRHQQQQQQRASYSTNTVPQNDNDMSAVSDAAAEIYSYSYNKNVDAPGATSTSSISESDASDSSVIPKEGTALAKDLVAKAKASQDDELEERSQGGSKLRALIEKAREKQPAFEQPIKQNPLLATENDAIVTPSSIMTPEEVANLSIEEQARLYREFFYVQQQKQKGAVSTSTTTTMQSQQQQSQQTPKSIGSTPDNYLEAGIGFDGRKIGRNKDADAISNASDVYFAQLKRDSTTRNIARYSGDHTKANEVFHDPSIQELKAPVNPYLQDQQKRMRDVVETVPEEMLLFQEYDDEEGKLSPEEMKTYSGISYKDKIKQKKLEREERRRNQQQNNIDTNDYGNGYSY